jgi:hypothetical protein
VAQGLDIAVDALECGGGEQGHGNDAAHDGSQETEHELTAFGNRDGEPAAG